MSTEGFAFCVWRWWEDVDLLVAIRSVALHFPGGF